MQAPKIKITTYVLFNYNAISYSAHGHFKNGHQPLRNCLLYVCIFSEFK